MYGTVPFASRAFASGPHTPRPFVPQAIDGEYGWAAWSYSRQAKLNAWTWHGIGATNLNSWATLGNVIYIRRESDNFVHTLQPDVFLADGDENTESTSVEAVTQWLDFGKPGKRKALTGIDFDGQSITSVEIYVSVDGDRDGVLAETIAVGSSQDGWTYSGEMLPLSIDGTEFKLRFLGDANAEAQINRFSLHFDEIAG